jgi:DNA-binding NarL/FixJ family response regulator
MEIGSAKQTRLNTQLVYILSGHAYVAKQLASLLATEPGLEVRLVSDAQPDTPREVVVIVDQASLREPLDLVLRKTAIRFPGAKLIVIAGNEAALKDLLSMQRLGIHGWILQDDIGTCLVPTIQAVRQGLRCARTQDTPASTEATERLSEGREREVYEMLRRGLPNREIAAAMGVGESTVKTYVSNVFKKLGISSRRELALDMVPVRRAHRLGLVATHALKAGSSSTDGGAARYRAAQG